MILHITTHREWENAKIEGEYLTPSLESEGFIHCSTFKQTVDTANIFFKGQTGLVLLCIDEDKLKSKIKYESPTGGGNMIQMLAFYFRMYMAQLIPQP